VYKFKETGIKKQGAALPLSHKGLGFRAVEKMKKNKSVEANVHAARTAVNEMIKHWRAWKEAQHEQAKAEALAAYAAAYTGCKVYIENFLKHVQPSESKLPPHMLHNINRLVADMDAIEKMSDKRLQQVIHDIEELSRKAA